MSVTVQPLISAAAENRYHNYSTWEYQVFGVKNLLTAIWNNCFDIVLCTCRIAYLTF